MPNKSWFLTWGDRNRDVEHFRGFKGQIDSLFEDWFGRTMGGVLAPQDVIPGFFTVAGGVLATNSAPFSSWRQRGRASTASA
jgi:hypothetical protein